MAGMQALKIILLFIAYTMGIASLALQIACYRKRLEYRETILFTISLLLLVLILLVRSLFPPSPGRDTGIPELITLLITMIFGMMIPINIHQERIHSKRRIRNRVAVVTTIIVTGAAVFLFLQVGLKAVIYISTGFLFASVLYSMIFILATRPDSLIRFREKTERNTAVMIIVLMSASLLFFLYTAGDNPMEILNRYDGFTLGVITIILTLGKIPEDINKLSRDETMMDISRDKLDQSGISRRENEVLSLLVSGKTYREIGDELFISLPTVKTHVSSIYSKLKVRNRLELSNLVKNR